jgi:hypothetical protein
MKRWIAAAALLLLSSGAYADVLDDPLHGYCLGCVDNGTNTPLIQPLGGVVPQFGFTSSPANSGILTLEVLIPNDVSLLTLLAISVTGSSVGVATQFTNGFGSGLTQWMAGGIEGTNPTLASFLQNGASPDQNLNAYLGATQAVDAFATGYFVFTFLAGAFDLPAPGNIPTDLFNLVNGLPEGSFITGFLTTADGTTIGTANSAALFVTTFSVPGPLAGAGIPGLIAACSSLMYLVRRRRVRRMMSMG